MPSQISSPMPSQASGRLVLIAAAALYLWAAFRHRALIRHWLAGGVVFGVLAYLVMNLVVVPLSNAANPDFSLGTIVKELLAHTILFGVPIAGIVKALARKGWDAAPGA
jgi:uncharacterized membrane protein YagU involved in acid resistance